eukprot:6331034-Pyramimonas_sp.AAC.1
MRYAKKSDVTEDERLRHKLRERGSAGCYREVRLVHPDGASAQLFMISGWRTTTKLSGTTCRKATVWKQTTAYT